MSKMPWKRKESLRVRQYGFCSSISRSCLQAARVASILDHHGERNHQGLDNELIKPADEVGQIAGKIECRERLGGLLRYYYRDAA